MQIKLLECNTVAADYDDGTNENINSGHAEKALTDTTRALAEAFTYGGAMDANRPESAEICESITFNGLTISMTKCTCHKREDGAVHKCGFKTTKLDPLETAPGDDARLVTFADIVFTDEVRQAFIDQLPLVPVMGAEQQLLPVEEGTPDAIEQVIGVPEGIDGVEIIDGVAIATTVYERRRWVLKVFNEDGSKHMVPVPLIDEDGEPVVEHYHRKTDTRYAVA